MPLSRCERLIELALQAESIEDVHALCSSVCEELGFDQFIYAAQFPTSLVSPHYVVISGYPKEWRDYYLANGYTAIDPTVAHCAARITPLTWDLIAPTDDKAGRILEEARDFGLNSGVSLPVHGGQGESAMLSLSSEEDPGKSRGKIRRALGDAHLVAAYVHEAVLRVFEGTGIPVRKVHLTEREKECLMWTAEGKTTWETSQILSVSERTIIFHLQNCTNKLNVTNRSQAVARAISQHLIAPALD